MEGVSKLVDAVLVEAPFGWPHKKPQAVVALIKEARSHLQRGLATRLYLLLVGAEHQERQVLVRPPRLASSPCHRQHHCRPVFRRRSWRRCWPGTTRRRWKSTTSWRSWCCRPLLSTTTTLAPTCATSL